MPCPALAAILRRPGRREPLAALRQLVALHDVADDPQPNARQKQRDHGFLISYRFRQEHRADPRRSVSCCGVTEPELSAALDRRDTVAVSELIVSPVEPLPSDAVRLPTSLLRPGLR